MINRSMVVVIGVMLAGTGAHANTITQNFSTYETDLVYNPAYGEDPVYYGTDRATFNGFDTSLGTLVGASLTYRGIVFPGFLAYTDESTGATLTPAPETPLVTLFLGSLAQGSYSLPQFTQELAEPYAAYGSPLVYTAAGENFDFTVPLNLIYLSNPDPFSVNFGAGTRFNGLDDVMVADYEDGTALQASLTLTYEYSSVPEPSSLAVLAIPAGVLLMRRRAAVSRNAPAAIAKQPYV